MSARLLVEVALGDLDKKLAKRGSELAEKVAKGENVCDLFKEEELETCASLALHSANPEELLLQLLLQHGTEAEKLMPSLVLQRLEAVRQQRSVEKSSQAEEQLSGQWNDLSRLWNWLQTNGRTELHKARSFEAACRVLKPFCRLHAATKLLPEHEKAKKEAVEQLKNKLKDLLSSEETKQKLAFHLGTHEVASVNMEQAEKFTLLKSKSTCINICSSFSFFFASSNASNVSPTSPNCLRFHSTTDGLALSLHPRESDRFANVLVKSLLTPTDDSDSTSLIGRVRSLSRCLKPLAFVKRSISSACMGKFIGKFGKNITTLQSQSSMHCMFRLGVSSGFTVVASNYRPLDGRGQVATLGIWIHNEELLEKITNDPSLHLEISRFFRAQLDSAVSRASQKSALRPCRLPHLIQLRSFTLAADKDRARLKRYRKEKNRLKDMRTYEVWSSRDAKSRKWQISGNQLKCLYDETEKGVKRSKEERRERKKQFVATKAASDAFAIEKRVQRRERNIGYRRCEIRKQNSSVNHMKESTFKKKYLY